MAGSMGSFSAEPAAAHCTMPGLSIGGWPSDLAELERRRLPL